MEEQKKMELENKNIAEEQQAAGQPETKPESALAYKDTLEVSQILRSYYPEECYITGNTPSTMDMENILKVDYQRVNNLAMLGVFVVVMMSFHSPVMPLVSIYFFPFASNRAGASRVKGGCRSG